MQIKKPNFESSRNVIQRNSGGGCVQYMELYVYVRPRDGIMEQVRPAQDDIKMPEYHYYYYRVGEQVNI